MLYLLLILILISLASFGGYILKQQELNLIKQSLQELLPKTEKLSLDYTALKESLPKLVKAAREDAVKTSRAVLKGKISEEMVPLMGRFPFKASDCRFFGSPLDYIIFEGISEGKITSITLLDVKTGGARLTDIQKQIKGCVENNRVKWVTFNSDTEDGGFE